MPPPTLRPLRRGTGYPYRRAPRLTHRQWLRRWLAGTSPLDPKQVEQGRRLLAEATRLDLRITADAFTLDARKAMAAARIWFAREWATSINEPWRLVATDPFPLPEPADVAAFRFRLREKSARVYTSFGLAPPPLVPWGDLAPAYEAHMQPIREAAAVRQAEEAAQRVVAARREQQRAEARRLAALRALLPLDAAARAQVEEEDAAVEAAWLGLGDLMDDDVAALAALFR